MSLPPDLIQLRADLLRRVAEHRVAAVQPEAPLDPAAVLAPLTTALESAAGQSDPVPRPPFPSHRARGAGLVRALKGAVSLVMRPLTRLLFQRQADFNRHLLRTSELLAADVRLLAERSATQAEQAAAGSHDARRAREERLIVLDTLAAMSDDLRALREGGPGAPEIAARMDRLEQKLDDLSRRLAASARP